VPGSKVHAVSYGPTPRTEEVLRAAIALGADLATWVEAPPGVAADPILAARSLASLGLRGGDFISIKGSQRESFYELGGAPAVARSRLITRSIP